MTSRFNFTFQVDSIVIVLISYQIYKLKIRWSFLVVNFCSVGSLWVSKWVFLACVESHLNFKAFQRKFGTLWEEKSHQNPTRHSWVQANPFLILSAVITQWSTVVLTLFERRFNAAVIRGWCLFIVNRWGRTFSYTFKEKPLNYIYVLVNLSFASAERNYFPADILFYSL